MAAAAATDGQRWLGRRRPGGAELADVVGEVAEGASEQHGRGVASSLWWA
jgi:hypothetical protein